MHLYPMLTNLDLEFRAKSVVLEIRFKFKKIKNKY